MSAPQFQACLAEAPLRREEGLQVHTHLQVPRPTTQPQEV